jgi:hypothetical protein
MPLVKVNDTSSARSAPSVRKRAGVAGGVAGAFEGLLNATGAAEISEAAGVGAAGGIGSIDSMLALQSMSEEESRRKAAVKHGESMLDSLESLRASLLAGRIPPEVLRELGSRLARQRAEALDPKLIEILDDIELRVAVEKAKLEQAARGGYY